MDGRRVTDAAMLEAVQMVLLGRVNPLLVGLVQDAGAPAVGVAGTDGLLQAHVTEPELGLVGEVDTVDVGLLDTLLDAGKVPVIARTRPGVRRPRAQCQRRHRGGGDRDRAGSRQAHLR